MRVPAWCALITLLTVASAAARVNYDGIAVEMLVTPWEGSHPPSRGDAAAVKLANLADGIAAVNEHHRPIANTLVVLPEYGLTGPDFATRDSVLPFAEDVPDPGDRAVPCGNATMNETSPALHAASCYSVALQSDVVLDLPEIVRCEGRPGCPTDGRFQFNTLVAVRGADGAVVGRYRKTHLYYEPAFDSGSLAPTTPWFDASFGVRFGLLVCFDMMFAEPTGRMLREGGVEDVAYATWWVNMPPFLTATQVQAGWARRGGVNLVAAGVGHNGWRSSGSGVYASSGAAAPRHAEIFNSALAPRATSAVILRDVATRSTSRRPRVAGRGMPAEPLAAPQDGVWALNQTLFQASRGANVTVHAGAVECHVLAVGADGAASEYAAIAAQGSYNGIFPTVMCGACACPAPTKPCFIGQDTLRGGASLPALSLRMTVCNATGSPEQWRVFANGAADGGESASLSAATSWSPVPNRPQCGFTTVRMEPPAGGQLDALLYGIQAAPP